MRVVIAEDSVLLREGLERLLSESGLEVVGFETTPNMPFCRAFTCGAPVDAPARDESAAGDALN
jgi:hypothetical protein